MTSEDEERKKQCYQEICIPEEVRVKYFPQYTNKFSYNILPLFVLDEYHKKIMQEVSILENPRYGNKWREFVDAMPKSVLELKPVLIASKTPIFANYRRKKVPPEYLTSFIGPSNPSAIFRKTK